MKVSSLFIYFIYYLTPIIEGWLQDDSPDEEEGDDGSQEEDDDDEGDTGAECHKGRRDGTPWSIGWTF